MDWSDLENSVREIASIRYARPCEKIRLETGVAHDCVLKLDENHWIIVEITKNKNLDKIRGDVNRLFSNSK